MKPFAYVAIGAIAYYVLATGAMHFLNRELDPVIWPMSAYVLGPFGFLMTTTFFVLALALVAFVIALVSPPKNRSVTVYIGAFLFLVAVVGAVMAGFFPMDAEFPPQSLSGKLHGIGGMLGFPMMAIAPLFITFGLLRRTLPFTKFLFMAILCVAVLACFPLMIAAIEMGQENPAMRIAGLMQRLFFLFLFAWMTACVVMLPARSLE